MLNVKNGKRYTIIVSAKAQPSTNLTNFLFPGCTALMLALLKHIPHHPVHDRLKIIQLLVDEDERQNFKAKVCVSLCLLSTLFICLSLSVFSVCFTGVFLSPPLCLCPPLYTCIFLCMSHSLSLSLSLSLSVMLIYPCLRYVDISL